jgi:hypothetical protein
MKTALAIAAAMMCAATPAFATGSIQCATAARGGPGIILNVSGGPGPRIEALHLVDGRTRIDVARTGDGAFIAQSWLDDHDLRLDVVDANDDAFVLRLRGRAARAYRYATTLTWHGRTYAMTCTWDE